MSIKGYYTNKSGTPTMVVPVTTDIDTTDKANNGEWHFIQAVIDSDKKALHSLRYTYKTGEPMWLNEWSYNSRQLIDNGSLGDYRNLVSPLNVLQNYEIRYNRDNNTMEYRDVYDFNAYEPFIPGGNLTILKVRLS